MIPSDRRTNQPHVGRSDLAADRLSEYAADLGLLEIDNDYDPRSESSRPSAGLGAVAIAITGLTDSVRALTDYVAVIAEELTDLREALHADLARIEQRLGER